MNDKVLKTCGFPACGRPLRSARLCQTHYKQQLRGQELKPIALRRAKRKGTVRYAGMSLTEACANAIKACAQRMNWTASAVMIDILESWAKRQAKEK